MTHIVSEEVGSIQLVASHLAEGFYGAENDLAEMQSLRTARTSECRLAYGGLLIPEVEGNPC